jgi:very-short-patch-repair endonuclease
MKRTPQQILLQVHLKELGIKTMPEYRFCARKWRFDLVALDERLAFEISGGNWTGGHRRGKAQEQEYDKLNLAQLLGWRVMQFTNRQVASGEAKQFLAQWVAKRAIPAQPRRSSEQS